MGEVDKNSQADVSGVPVPVYDQFETHHIIGPTFKVWSVAITLSSKV